MQILPYERRITPKVKATAVTKAMEDTTLRHFAEPLFRAIFFPQTLLLYPMRGFTLWLYSKTWESLVEGSSSSLLELLSNSGRGFVELDLNPNKSRYTIDGDAMKSAFSWLRAGSGALSGGPRCDEWMHVRGLEASTTFQLAFGAAVAKELKRRLIVVDAFTVNALKEAPFHLPTVWNMLWKLVWKQVSTPWKKVWNGLQLALGAFDGDDGVQHSRLAAPEPALCPIESTASQLRSHASSGSCTSISSSPQLVPCSPMTPQPFKNQEQLQRHLTPMELTSSPQYTSLLRPQPWEWKDMFAADVIWQHCRQSDSEPVVLQLLNVDHLMQSHQSFLFELKRLTMASSQAYQPSSGFWGLVVGGWFHMPQVLLIATSSMPHRVEGVQELESNFISSSSMITSLFDVALLPWRLTSYGLRTCAALVHWACMSMVGWQQPLLKTSSSALSSLFSFQVDIHPAADQHLAVSLLPSANDGSGASSRGQPGEFEAEHMDLLRYATSGQLAFSKWLEEQERDKRSELEHAAWSCLQNLPDAHLSRSGGVSSRWFPPSNDVAAVLSWAVGYALAQGTSEPSGRILSCLDNAALSFGIHMTCNACQPRVHLPVDQLHLPNHKHMRHAQQLLLQEVRQHRVAAELLGSAGPSSGLFPKSAATADRSDAESLAGSTGAVVVDEGVGGSSQTGDDENTAPDSGPVPHLQEAQEGSDGSLLLQLEVQQKALADALADKESLQERLQRELGSLEEELRLLRQKHSQAVEEKERNAARYRQEDENAKDLSRRLEQLKRDLAGSVQALSAMEACGKQREEELRRQVAAEGRLRQELERAEEGLKARTANLVKLREGHAEQAEEWRKREQELRSHEADLARLLEAASRRVELAEAAKQAAEGETRRLRGVQAQLTAEVQSLVQGLQASQAEQNQLHHQYLDLVQSCREGRQELTTAQAEMAAVSAEKLELELRIAKQERDLTRLRRKTAALQKATEELHQGEQLAVQIVCIVVCYHLSQLQMHPPVEATTIPRPWSAPADPYMYVRSLAHPPPVLPGRTRWSENPSSFNSLELTNSQPRLASQRGRGSSTRGPMLQGGRISLNSGAGMDQPWPADEGGPLGLAGSILLRSRSESMKKQSARISDGTSKQRR